MYFLLETVPKAHIDLHLGRRDFSGQEHGLWS